MTKFADPDFEYHRAIGLIWLNVALQIATTPLVPYNVSDYAVFMRYEANRFAQENEQTLLKHQITLSEYSIYYRCNSKLVLNIYENLLFLLPMYAALFNASTDMFISACNSFQAELDHAREKTLRLHCFFLF